MKPNLTERQAQVLELFDDGWSVIEIAQHLGLSRNSIYLVLRDLKREGVVPVDWTPSGRPARTPMAVDRSNGTPGAPVIRELLAEVDRTQQELDTIADRLARLLDRSGWD